MVKRACVRTSRSRRYWIVKHGYDALQALPNVIWRTGSPEEPSVFRRVKKGDRWIGFAYTTTDAKERPLSLVTGFYECVRESKYRTIPQRARGLTPRLKKAWMIQGSENGWQAGMPVGVPSIEDMLGHPIFRQSTLTAISRDEFLRIRAEVKRRRLDPKKIPLLGREPRNEQEVVAVVVAGHKQLGIEKFIRIRSGFPDMLVKLRGKAEPVHLELEVYSSSFLSHRHPTQIKVHDYYSEDVNGVPDKKSVAVLCWIDDVRSAHMKKAGRVSRVFELQRLVRERRRIKWPHA